MENTSIVVSQAMVMVRDISFVSEEDKKAAVKAAVVEQVKALVQASFSGSVATAQLFEHFSLVGGIEHVGDSFAAWCYERGEWLKKADIGTGKSSKLSGWKALRRHAAKLLLIETNQTWSDELSDTAISTAVRAIWSQSANDKAKRYYINATVYNNLASYKSSYLTKKAAEKSPEPVEPVQAEQATAETVMAEIKSEAKHTVKSMLAEVQREISAVQNDPKATKQDLLDLMDYVSQMVAMLLA